MFEPTIRLGSNYSHVEWVDRTLAVVPKNSLESSLLS